MKVRPAQSGDAAAMAAIYNEGIAGGQAAFTTVGKTEEELREQVASETYPALVAERDGEVVGCIWAVKYSVRAVYDGVAECSVYVSSSARGGGIGRALVDALAEECERRGFYKLIGLVFTTNETSVRLLTGAGFREVGVHRRHGTREGEWRDVMVVERLLGEAAASG